MLENNHNLPDVEQHELPRLSEGADSRLTKLQEEERLWFSWLTVLHGRLTKTKPGATASEGRKVLEIAKRRWAEAKAALRDYRSGDLRSGD
jgi:hypothetical protein